MRLHKNIYLWYATTFLSSAAFTLPIWVIFNTEILGLSNTQAFILGVIPFGLSTIFEIPTGSWADRYGRVKIYTIGVFLYIISVASFLFFRDFWVLAILQIVGSLGLAMSSGSLQALVHDSIKGKDKDEIYAKVHGNRVALLFISRVVTVLIGGVLFVIDPMLPIILTVIVYTIGLLVSLFFKEVRLETATEQTDIQHIIKTLKLILQRKSLTYFLVLIALLCFAAEVLFAIYQPYFKSINIELEQFGVFYAIISLSSAFGAVIVARILKRHNAFVIMPVLMLSIIFTLGAMLLKSPWIVYVAIIPSAIANGCITTMTNTAVQKHISSSHQASALSIASLVTMLPYLIATIMTGVMLDIISVNTLNKLILAFTVVALIPFIVFAKRKPTV